MQSILPLSEVVLNVLYPECLSLYGTGSGRRVSEGTQRWHYQPAFLLLAVDSNIHHDTCRDTHERGLLKLLQKAAGITG